MTEKKGFCIVGFGSVFDAIEGDASGYGLPFGWLCRRAGSVAALSTSSAPLLEGLDPATTRLFVAVDQNALNYARLELYGSARLRGFRLDTLIHASAIVAPDAHLGDNAWVGPGVLIGSHAHVGSDVFVNAGARIDANVRIGAHGWVGPGAKIGINGEIGVHCVIGADVRVGAGLRIGHHCLVDTGERWQNDLSAGSFVADQFTSPARIIGAGYSFERRR